MNTPEQTSEFLRCPCCMAEYSKVDDMDHYERVKTWSPGRAMGRLGGKTTGPTKARANRGADWGKSLARAKATKKLKRLSEGVPEAKTRGLGCPEKRSSVSGGMSGPSKPQNAPQPMVRGSNV